MNIAESASVEHLMISRGWEKAEHPEEANLVVINTCSVRGSAEQRILGRLGYFEGVKKIRMGDQNTKIRLDDMKIAAKFFKENGIPHPALQTVNGSIIEVSNSNAEDGEEGRN